MRHFCSEPLENILASFSDDDDGQSRTLLLQMWWAEGCVAPQSPHAFRPSAEIKKAQARQPRRFKKTAVQILALQHRKLFGRHFPAIGPELRI